LLYWFEVERVFSRRTLGDMPSMLPLVLESRAVASGMPNTMPQQSVSLPPNLILSRRLQQTTRYFCQSVSSRNMTREAPHFTAQAFSLDEMVNCCLAIERYERRLWMCTNPLTSSSWYQLQPRG
jgi:hypothetical protein